MNDRFSKVENWIGNARLAPEKKRRFLMGASMGGLGSMKLACRHPLKFAAAAELGGPLNMAGARLLYLNLGVPEFIDVFGSAPIRWNASESKVNRSITFKLDQY